MRERVNQDMILGALALAFGLFIVFWWAQVDSDTGVAEKIRGRWSVGDALAPTAAGAVIAVSGLFVLLGGWFRGRGDDGLTVANARYLATFIIIIAVGFACIRYAGPLAADVLGRDYRALRDEVPWKYIGFVLGGGGMIFALMTLAEGRARMGRFVLAFAIATGLALIYDLPFEDLLLPPNGDV